MPMAEPTTAQADDPQMEPPLTTLPIRPPPTAATKKVKPLRKLLQSVHLQSLLTEPLARQVYAPDMVGGRSHE